MKSCPCNTIDHTLRTALGELLTRIEGTAVRALTATDPEDIHDLRVATRRTRTILGQVPGAFPNDTVKFFRQGFRRIGNTTGKCRDLDVWLEAIAENRDNSDANGPIPLDPLEELIRRHRDEARAQVTVELQAPWFPTLLHQWRTFLQTPPETLSSRASRPPEPTIGAAILKAHRRLLKHGNALPDQPQAAQFHRLRIDGKKLRYLLEFFGILFDPEGVQSLIERLKSLQDVLGGINDREIQLKALDGLDGLDGNPDPTVILAIERHRLFLQKTVEGFRSTFTDEFKAFADPGVTRFFQRMFGY